MADIGCNLRAREVRAFKDKWPCHGLDAVNTAWFGFWRGGDLAHIKLYNAKGRELSSTKYDGPALTALCAVAWDKVRPTPANALAAGAVRLQ
jgi:hypothetical protein